MASLEVSATFANPVHNGRSVRPPSPATELWALLYAQVHQAADAERRNILLGTRILSCLAVETLPGDAPWSDPLGAQLGYERFLRTSTLVAVPGCADQNPSSRFVTRPSAKRTAISWIARVSWSKASVVLRFTS